MLSDKQNYLDVLQENIATVIKTSTAASEEAIDQRLMELQKEITHPIKTKSSNISLRTSALILFAIKKPPTIYYSLYCATGILLSPAIK